MDYKQEIIASIKENHGVFGLLSENLRSDPDIALVAWKRLGTPYGNREISMG